MVIISTLQGLFFKGFINNRYPMYTSKKKKAKVFPFEEFSKHIHPKKTLEKRVLSFGRNKINKLKIKSYESK